MNEDGEAAWERMDKAHAYRLALLAGGYVPIPLNGKRPTNTAWQSDVAPEESEIASWKTTCGNAFNTGILTKWTPAIDIDVTDGVVANAIADRAAELIDEDAPLLVRFGKHPKRAILFRTDEPFDKIRTSDFASLDGATHHVEILCNGQQLAAFGRHPETGNEYEWPNGAPGSIRQSELPLLTKTMAKQFVDAAADIMRRAGWEEKKSKRPAENGAKGPTASAGEGGYRERQYAKAALDGCAIQLANSRPGGRNDALNKAAFRLGKMIARGWTDEKTVTDALVGACDANRYLREHGHRAMMKTIESAIEAGKKDPHPDLPEREPLDDRRPTIDVAPSVVNAVSVAWPEPKPLPSGLAPVQPFDIDFMPTALAPWIDDITQRLQCPPDYVAVAAVTALGSVIGRRVGIKPQARTDWIEIPNIWGCFIGRPGALKSPAMNEALRPIHRLEAEAAKENEIAQQAYEAGLSVFKLRKEVAIATEKKRLKKAGEQKIDIDLNIGEPPAEPVPVRYRTNDSSYESLGELLIDNPAGILIERDELVSLLKHLDRDDQSVARGFYQTGWGGASPYTFDRITRGHRHIEAVCLSVLGNTQPARICEYVRRANWGGAGGDGLIQRFGLMVWPDAMPEWHNVDEYPDGPARERAWQVFERASKLDLSAALALGATRGTFETVPCFRFDEAAYDDFLGWRTDLERRLRSGEMSPALEGHLAKYRKLVPALALINHIADGDQSGAVSQNALLRALAFGNYLEGHARRVYSSESEAELAAGKAILKHIHCRDLKDGFTARDIQRTGWAHLTEREHIGLGLQLLVDLDYLGANTSVVGPQGGRPKVTYVINPRAVQ